MCVSDADCGTGSRCKSGRRLLNIQVAGDEKAGCSEHCEDAVTFHMICIGKVCLHVPNSTLSCTVRLRGEGTARPTHHSFVQGILEFA